MTNEIEEAFISFWGRYYGHDSGCWVEIQICDMRIVKEEVLCELDAWGDD